MQRTVFLFMSVLLIGCGNKPTDVVDGEDQPFFVPVEHAKNFTLQSKNGYTVLQLKDPWNEGGIYHTYLLGSEGQLAKLKADAGTTKVVTPIKDIALSGSPYVGYLERIGKVQHVVAVDRFDLVYSSVLRQRIADGKVKPTGGTGQLNLEVLAEAKPDIFIVSAFPESEEKLQKISELGIPVLYALEWQEHNPLGRLEWLKVFGALTNTYADAEIIYQQARDHYMEVLESSRKDSNQVDVMVGSMWQGIWHTPAGESYMAHMLRDAGMNYAHSEIEGTGSYAAPLEVIFSKQHDADVWINPGAVESLKALFEKNDKYGSFRCARNGSVYNYDAQRVENANAFWETAAVYPDVLLQDLIHIASGNPPDSVLYFYRKVPSE